MITKLDRNTINIFTDASIYNLKVGGKVKETIGCPGYIVVWNGVIIDAGCTLLRNSTNNIAELYAILLGVEASKSYGANYKIRIFSDSQLSVFAIRDRIFNWIGKSDGNLLYTVDGNPVANQSYIMSIIYTILSNGFPITILHQKGHVNINNYKDIYKAKDVFKTSNNIRSTNDITDDFIVSISYFNNYVDNMTRMYLHNHLSEIENIGLNNVFEFVYRPFDIEKYKEYLHKK